MLNYVIFDDRIQIIDSAFIKKKYFRKCLEQISNENADNETVKNRFYYSAICEWAVHNFCYSINFKKERTKDVDINTDLSLFAKIAYYILGTISWLLIK